MSIFVIKFNERTSDKNQMFIVDVNKHYLIFTLEDNINYASYVKPYTPPNPKISLTKYHGFGVYGIFKGYSRIDGFSIFKIDTKQIDRDLKIYEILK